VLKSATSGGKGSTLAPETDYKFAMTACLL
jgi:hypothetical protein